MPEVSKKKAPKEIFFYISLCSRFLSWIRLITQHSTYVTLSVNDFFYNEMLTRSVPLIINHNFQEMQTRHSITNKDVHSHVCGFLKQTYPFPGLLLTNYK